MKLGILHLSDIHIRHVTDKALEAADCVARACFQTAHESECLLIAITGDLAFSGKKHEYTLINNLITNIKNKIATETSKEIFVVSVPGNHDCDLIPEDEIRTLTIDKIIEDPIQAYKLSYVEKCTAAQADYFEFEKDTTNLVPVFSSSLWKEYELNVGDGLVRISAINAAWMSKLNEVQGQLVFPIENYMDCLEAPSTLRIGLIHHPLNWYCQSTFHPLKSALRTHCGAILSGHEHSIGSEVISESSGASTLLFEAPALQPHEKGLESQFVCLLFDTEENSVTERRYQVTAALPLQLGAEISHSIKLSEKCSKKNKINPEFGNLLLDPGGNFTHPDRGDVSAEEIFIYPELEDSSAGQDKRTIYADQLISGWRNKNRTLILGDEEAGKTFLLYRAFMDIHLQGGLPLYIKHSDFGSITDRELDKLIDSLAGKQYSNKSEFLYADKKDKVALIDDLDRINGSPKLQAKLIAYLEERFGTVYMSASARFRLSELIDSEMAELLSAYSNYKIRSFGHVMRHRLIKKWCLMGDISTNAELDRKVYEIETLINIILGKNLVPSKPIYLLILLQSSVQQQQGELQNSSFSYYYEYLVTKSLKDAGFRPDHLNEMFTYLSRLAWHFKEAGSKELDSISLRSFNTKFTDEITSVDFDQRIAILCKSKILTKNGGFYRFNYAYIYYLFIGKYLGDNLHKPEIADIVSVYCKELYKKENANSIIFLTHHRSDPLVTEKISDTLKSCFATYEPFEFNGDVSAINCLVESTAQLLIGDIDIEQTQTRSRKMADDFESSEHDDFPEPQQTSPDHDKNKIISFASDINLMARTSEILGNITKNYYGSIERPRKQDYLRQVFDGALRTLKAVFSEIVDQPDAFVAEIERVIKERKPDIEDFALKDQAKKFAFQVVGMICTTLIAKTAEIVSSDKVREDLVKVVQQNPNNSYRLIGVATSLIQPGHIPFDDIEKLAKDLMDNSFAFTILQSLVYYHLHMFHTSDRDKQRLAALVNITMQQSRSIDATSKRTKMSKDS